MAWPRLGGWVARIALVLALFMIVGCALLPDLRPRIADADAIAIARAAAPDRFRDEPVLSVVLIPYREVGSAFAPVLGTRPPSPELLVWFVSLGSESAPQMGSGVFVILDGATGEVIHVTEWIS